MQNRRIDWLEFSDYFRVLREELDPSVYEGRSIICTRPIPMVSTKGACITEFEKPCGDGFYDRGRINMSFAYDIFPTMHPRWSLGESVVLYRQTDVLAWLKNNFKSLTYITTARLIYVTSENADDITLLRLYGREYDVNYF